MRFYQACTALYLGSATAFVPLSQQPKRASFVVVPSTDFSPRTTALYGKKNKQEGRTTLVDKAAADHAVKVEAVEEKVEVSSSVEVQAPEEKGEEKGMDPQLLIDEEHMGKVIEMMQAA
jgi:hypothetical protein